MKRGFLAAAIILLSAGAAWFFLRVLLVDRVEKLTGAHTRVVWMRES